MTEDEALQEAADSLTRAANRCAIPPRIESLLHKIISEGWQDEQGESLVEDAIRALGGDWSLPMENRCPVCWGNPDPRLISDLAACRDAFPTPEPGHPAEEAWMQAISDPLSVSAYVQMRVKERK